MMLPITGINSATMLRTFSATNIIPSFEFQPYSSTELIISKIEKIEPTTGANFIAANDGIVTKASYNSAYGNMVIIDHGGGVSTLYAHGSEIKVTLGQTVKKGDVVLLVGDTGYATGAHGHFEVRINGTPVDPLPYVTNQNGVN